MGTLPTIFAGEVVLTTNTHMQAIGTGLGRVARVNMQHAHARRLRLVLDELLELIERPRVQGTALSLVEPATVPDAFEDLKDNGQAVFFGVGDHLLADFVVDSFLVASLPTGKPLSARRQVLRVCLLPVSAFACNRALTLARCWR